MTFQPPPPPPGGMPPAGPPPAQWGPPPGGSGGSSSFDPKSVNPLDWGIVGAGLLAFIFSFIDYYTFSGKGEFSSASVSESAWSGFFGWFAMLLAVAGSVVVALSLFMPQVKLPFPPRLAALGAYVVAFLCLVLAFFVVPDYMGGGPGYDSAVDEGHGFGYWASLIVILAGAVLSLMRLQATGGQLPGGLSGKIPNIGGYGPQGGISGGQQAPGYGTPPPAGYGTPPPPPQSGPPQSGPPQPGPGYGNQPPPPPPGYGPPR